MMDKAELRLATTGEWITKSVDEELRLGEKLTYRCLECWGQVKPHSAASDGTMVAHFEHNERNPGCSQIPKHFDGTRRRHQKPLE
jgi:hypothetical protein